MVQRSFNATEHAHKIRLKERERELQRLKKSTIDRQCKTERKRRKSAACKTAKSKLKQHRGEQEKMLSSRISAGVH